MDIKRIEHCIKPSIRDNRIINIRFRGRSPMTGLFVQGEDYDALKSKNFWRIVPVSLLQQWLESNDISLARIFNGTSFTSLSQTKS